MKEHKLDSTEQFHIARLTEGNTNSFIWIHQQYQSKVYAYCFKFVRNKEVVEEITSDVFVKLWEKRVQLNPTYSINGLLFKITRDFCLSYLRKVSKNTILRKEFTNNYLDHSPNPIENLLFHKESLKIANKAIENLPPKCKQVFHLRYFNELSLQQIANELNISPNTVQNHLSKGTKLVKRYLQRHGDLVFILLIGMI